MQLSATMLATHKVVGLSNEALKTIDEYAKPKNV